MDNITAHQEIRASMKITGIAERSHCTPLAKDARWLQHARTQALGCYNLPSKNIKIPGEKPGKKMWPGFPALGLVNCLSIYTHNVHTVNSLLPSRTHTTSLTVYTVPLNLMISSLKRSNWCIGIIIQLKPNSVTHSLGYI